MSDVFSGIAQGVGTSEFLEADKIGKLAPQIEEQISLRLELTCPP
jgi:hypothetical protein